MDTYSVSEWQTVVSYTLIKKTNFMS